MMQLLSFTQFFIFQTFGLLLVIVAGVLVVSIIWRKIASRRLAVALCVLVVGLFVLAFFSGITPRLTQYPMMLRTFGPGDGPSLPLHSIFSFFQRFQKFERVQDIARDPNDVPPPITRNHAETVDITLETKEVIAEVAPGVIMNYWTFNGTVPGPMLRVRERDTVRLTLKNDPTSLHSHSIDLHAVTGPGGGAAVTTVAPGESKTFSFQALNPGLFVYHCAYPNVATHMAHGMYGLILVEPTGGLPSVDKEFYVMQGEAYADGHLGKRGLQAFDAQAMLDGQPQYVFFNGRVKALGENMKALVGDRIRLFVGNGGVNLVSSFHMIGEIFDTVYPEASVGGALFKNVQTTLVPAGGAAITDFKVEVPGKFILVDHALARLDRGAWGILQVSGAENKTIFDGVPGTGSGH